MEEAVLQRRQLEQVAVRFAPEIATLHDFFASVEPPLLPSGDPAAVTARLRTDAHFHRDLGAHLLLLAHTHADAAGAPVLLAMVTLAAAGISGACDTREDDAHALLRFIFATTAPASQPSPRHHAEQVPLQALPRQRTALWLPLAAVLLIMAAGTTYLVRRPAVPVPTPASSTAAVPQPNSKPASPAASDPLEDIAPPSQPRQEPSVSRPHLPGEANVRRTPPTFSVPKQQRRDTATRAATPVEAGQATAPTVSAAHNSLEGRPNQPSALLSSSGTSTTGSRTAQAVPSSILSQRLDARRLPAWDTADNASAGRTYPHLLRRRPLLPLQPQESDGTTPTLLAENTVPTRTGSTRAPLPAVMGTVHPVSLGIMAGNILYSPAPAYPAQAAAAHVQGDVTIQAEVDRDGNVASARVVSGPPLLRDAALDAVQRWRYRPHLVAGRAATAAATAVVEFALP